MLIILDVKFLTKKYRHGSYHFIVETIIEMARRYATDSFIFLTHEQAKSFPDQPSNVSIEYIKKGPLPILGRKWWYKFVLPKKLKKWQPSLFIAADNVYVNNNKLPTCLFIIQLNLSLEGSKAKNRSGSVHNILSAALKQATALITFSDFSRQLIQNQTAISMEKIKLLGLEPTHTVVPLTWTEKESIKVQYAAGCEYFVFAGEIDSSHNLFGLLKSFSQFKKRQQSNMQLVLVGNKTKWIEVFNEKLSTFKFRADVHVVTNPSRSELETIIAAAYAFVYPAQFDYFPLNVIRAMQAGVPVIASKVPVIEELAGDAVIYPVNNDEDGFGKSMQDIYKDENLRSRVIETANRHLLPGKQYDMVEDCRNFFEAVFTSKS